MNNNLACLEGDLSTTEVAVSDTIPRAVSHWEPELLEQNKTVKVMVLNTSTEAAGERNKIRDIGNPDHGAGATSYEFRLPHVGTVSC